jgi:hypothetical protein
MMIPVTEIEADHALRDAGNNRGGRGSGGNDGLEISGVSLHSGIVITAVLPGKSAYG